MRRIWKNVINTYPSLLELEIVTYLQTELSKYEDRGEIADDA